MWESDNHVRIGIIGELITLVLFIPLSFILKWPYKIILILLLAILVFFTAYIFGGVKSSVKWIVYTCAICGFASLAHYISSWLQLKNLISPEIQNLVSYALLATFSYSSYKLTLRVFRKFEGVEQLENYEHILTEHDLVEFERKYKKGAIYLIEPKMFDVDFVFKIIIKNNNIFYCRVGGQFYEVDEISLKYSCEVDENILLSDKSNYKIQLNLIRSISLNRKKSRHTGAIPNNGIVYISIDNEKKVKKYIIHPINEYDEVKVFFEKIQKITIEEKKVFV